MILPILRYLFVVFLRITIVYIEIRYRDKRRAMKSLSHSIFQTIPFISIYFVEFIEFVIDVITFGDTYFSNAKLTVLLGIILSIFGFFIRYFAIKDFDVQLDKEKSDDGQKKKILITTGIYEKIRHPEYLGILLLSVGSELFLQNIIAAIVTAAITWKYLSDLIQEEETKLVAIFGNEYVSYRGSTPSYIPYID